MADVLGLPVQAFLTGTAVPHPASEVEHVEGTPEEAWEELSAVFQRIDDPQLRRLLVEVAHALSAPGE